MGSSANTINRSGFHKLQVDQEEGWESHSSYSFDIFVFSMSLIFHADHKNLSACSTLTPLPIFLYIWNVRTILPFISISTEPYFQYFWFFLVPSHYSSWGVERWGSPKWSDPGQSFIIVPWPELYFTTYF